MASEVVSGDLRVNQSTDSARIAKKQGFLPHKTYLDQPFKADLLSQFHQLGGIIKHLRLARKWTPKYSLYSIHINYRICEMGITELLGGTIIKSDYEELCYIKCLLKPRSTL